jgi:RNA polymerase subunit RPABC4/transcription elongation factor Spt4
MNSPVAKKYKRRRCKHCRNVILAAVEQCPECGHRTPRGWRNLGLRLLVLVIVVISLAFAYHIISESSPVR